MDFLTVVNVWEECLIFLWIVGLCLSTPSCMTLSVSCGGTDQLWLAAGTGALAAPDLGLVPYGINPLGEGCY